MVLRKSEFNLLEDLSTLFEAFLVCLFLELHLRSIHIDCCDRILVGRSSHYDAFSVGVPIRQYCILRGEGRYAFEDYVDELDT